MNNVKSIGMIGLAVATLAMLCVAQDTGAKKKRILFFSPSFGYRHSCVTRPLTGELSHAEKVIKKIGAEAGYEVAVSQDSHDLRSPEQFKRFDVIIFYTTGDPPINREALLKWVRDGGAFVGVHCATDTYYEWPEYNELIGGQFKTHGPADKPVTMTNHDPDHPATKHLGHECEFTDEIYQFREGTLKKDRLSFLLTIDTKKTDLKPQKMEADKFYPSTWTNKEGKGRVFYTALGHREEVWDDARFQKLLLGGIAWALGEAGGQ